MAIFGSDPRRGTPVDKIRNSEEKKFSAVAVGCPRVCNLNEFSIATHFDFFVGVEVKVSFERGKFDQFDESRN